MNPLVSAVIPTRNRPAMLRVAVLSALKQTYSNLEVVVVIDGPDQATVEMLHHLNDPRVRALELQQNVGGSEARNLGVRHANGEWIALLDDDDEWLPEKIEMQINAALASGSENPLVSCQYYFRSARKSDLLKPRRQPAHGENAFDFVLQPYCMLNTSTFLCRRDLYLKVPFEKGLPCLQDFDWYLHVVSLPDVQLIVVPKPLSIYNNPAGRATITSKVKWNFNFDWGQNHRALMSKSTYARYLVKFCVRHAIRQDAGLNAIRQICIEMFRHGSPSLKTIGMFMLFCVAR